MCFCRQGVAALDHGHVTEGYLVYGGNPTSPFHQFFVDLGAQRWTDWIFMLGLFAIGFALMTGVGTKLVMFAGPLMLLFMYLTQMWPTTNPFLDDHLIQALAIIGIVLVELGHQSIGFGTWWRKKVGDQALDRLVPISDTRPRGDPAGLRVCGIPRATPCGALPAQG